MSSDTQQILSPWPLAFVNPLVALFFLVLLGGCASVWERNFVGAPMADRQLRVDSEAIELREVPWERVRLTLEGLQADVIASDVHPDEWPPERQESAKRQLLRGLQVSEDATAVRVLGSARFRTTDQLSPFAGALAQHAASIGANRVVFARAETGTADRIVSAPVTVLGRSDIPLDRDGRTRWTGLETSTAYVPLVVRANETTWVLFWLRLDS